MNPNTISLIQNTSISTHFHQNCHHFIAIFDINFDQVWPPGGPIDLHPIGSGEILNMHLADATGQPIEQIAKEGHRAEQLEVELALVMEIYGCPIK